MATAYSNRFPEVQRKNPIFGMSPIKSSPLKSVDPNILPSPNDAVFRKAAGLSALMFSPPQNTQTSSFGYRKLHSGIQAGMFLPTTEEDDLDASIVSVDIDPEMMAMGTPQKTMLDFIPEANEESVLNDSGSYGFGPELPMEMERSQQAQALVTQSRWTNQQLRGGELTGFSNGMDARGAQISKQIAAQENVNSVRRVNEQLRGAECGQKAGVRADAAQISTEMAAQKNVNEYKRYNQNKESKPTLPANTVDNVRTANVQRNVANVRIVNNQVRGPGAGERTLFAADATQLSTESAAQQTIADYTRVNYTVNKAATAPTLPANTVDNVRTANAQRNVSDIRIVNEQVRGANPGYWGNHFGQGGVQLQTESLAQSNVSQIRRVNEQARGEHAGEKNLFDVNAREMQRQITAQRPMLVNDQVRAGVTPGNIDGESIDIKRTAQAQSTVFAARRVNDQVRGETAGQKTNFTVDARELQRHMAVPKPSLVNDQVRGTGAGKTTSEDVAFAHVRRTQSMCNTSNANKLRGFSSAFAGDAMQFKTLESVKEQLQGYKRGNEQVRAEPRRWTGFSVDYERFRKMRVESVHARTNATTYKGIKPTYVTVASKKSSAKDHESTDATNNDSEPAAEVAPKQPDAHKAFDRFVLRAGINKFL